MWLLLSAAALSWAPYRRLVRADALSRAEVRLVAGAEAYLRGSRISR